MREPAAGYDIHAVPVGVGGLEPGWDLARDGFAVTAARVLLAEGRLLVWLQASAQGELASPTVGHVAVGRHPWDTRLAVLEPVDVRRGVPRGVAVGLVVRALREAADAGAWAVDVRASGVTTDELGLPVDARADRVDPGSVPLPGDDDAARA